MSVYMYVAIPMFCVAALMFYLARKRREKNFLIPGLAMLVAGFVNAVLGLALG
ncbi:MULTISPECIES: hypothetical protein [Serratia]|uniref:hypothetical protein n=1 Tax=Serratia TaxID=613 RepID=UPI000DA3E39E|nr:MULTISPECIES: hypothetical protein [Serratia]MEB6338460.1 hypothetical protein [Serratia rhizosphaerae]SQJ09070.1 Uncharacterised protein [Serratia rubidaea]